VSHATLVRQLQSDPAARGNVSSVAAKLISASKISLVAVPSQAVFQKLDDRAATPRRVRRDGIDIGASCRLRRQSKS
jgi:hypothetical protein